MNAAESQEPRTPPPPRLRIAVVGTGRVGSVLGAALVRAGHTVQACTAVSDISRLRAESLLPGVPVLPVHEAVIGADLVLLAVPDDAIEDLARGLALTSAVAPGTFVAHTSGRHGLESLQPLTDLGCQPLAMHPVMTFTGTSSDLTRLGDCPFGVTAPEGLRPVVEALVVELGGDPVWVAQEHRALYHAGLALASNNLTTLVNESVDLLTRADVDDPARLVGALLTATLDNALRLGDQALTGPISRGDVGTVSAHIATLAAVSPRTLPVYIALGRLTATRAFDAGTISSDSLARMLEVLR